MSTRDYQLIASVASRQISRLSKLANTVPKPNENRNFPNHAETMIRGIQGFLHAFCEAAQKENPRFNRATFCIQCGLTSTGELIN